MRVHFQIMHLMEREHINKKKEKLILEHGKIMNIVNKK